jgi:hypothetical protein
MSRIDTSKTHSATSPLQPGHSPARGPARPGAMAPVDTALGLDIRPILPSRGREDGHEEAAARLPAVGSVPAADLEPIVAMTGDQLVGELARIDLLLKDKLHATEDPAMQASLTTGLAMIGESLRRLRLVHGGHDALVVNR